MSTLWEEKLEVIDATEAHWGTSTILAVFFAASLVSAIFFGLGYSFGRGGTPKPVGEMAFLDASASPAASTPVQPIQHSADQFGSHPDITTSVIAPQQDIDIAKPVHAALTQVSAIHSTPAADVPRKIAKPALIEAHAKTTAISAGAAHYMVQVGAIGDRKDARALVSQLRKRGFHAGIYSDKRDKFLHVQIGPFATTEQAQTMRHHVASSGYRAILKHAS